MAKIHIGKNGPGPCKATKGKCPLGGESGRDNHFDTMAEAEASYAKQQGGSAPQKLTKMDTRRINATTKAFKEGDPGKIARLYPDAADKIEGGLYYIVPSSAEEDEHFMVDEDFDDEDLDVDDGWGDDPSEKPSRQDVLSYNTIMDARKELISGMSEDGYSYSNGLVDSTKLNKEDEEFLQSGVKAASQINFREAVAIDTNKISDKKVNGSSDYEKFIGTIQESGVKVTNMFGEPADAVDSKVLLFSKDRIIVM